MSNITFICGTWKIEGRAAELVLQEQAELCLSKKAYRGRFGKGKAIQCLLMELFERRKKDAIEKDQAGTA